MEGIHTNTLRTLLDALASDADANAHADTCPIPVDHDYAMMGCEGQHRVFVGNGYMPTRGAWRRWAFVTRATGEVLYTPRHTTARILARGIARRRDRISAGPTGAVRSHIDYSAVDADAASNALARAYQRDGRGMWDGNDAPVEPMRTRANAYGGVSVCGRLRVANNVPRRADSHDCAVCR